MNTFPYNEAGATGYVYDNANCTYYNSRPKKCKICGGKAAAKSPRSWGTGADVLVHLTELQLTRIENGVRILFTFGELDFTLTYLYRYTCLPKFFPSARKTMQNRPIRHGEVSRYDEEVHLLKICTFNGRKCKKLCSTCMEYHEDLCGYDDSVIYSVNPSKH